MENLVEVKNNYVVTSSRQVAESFGKLHKDVLRNIHSLTSAQNCADVSKIREMFFETTEPDTYGRQQKIYYMNRDGFSLLVMGFTGKKALEWKIKYIEAFNRMEEALKERQHAVCSMKRYTFKGEIVMPATYFCTVIGISDYTLRHVAKQVSGSYKVLVDEELRLFKQENPGMGRKASRLAVFKKDTAVAILKSAGIYQQFKQFIDEYFYITPRSLEMKQVVYVDVPDNANIQAWIAKIEASLQETKNLLQLYNGYHTPENLETYHEALKQAAANVYAQSCALRVFDLHYIHS